ncbi:MAG: aminomethyl transferase family protein [Acidimicrobiia bacterium]|nr:aminomethyl transferase family protein [Acidimicrobiia bacterium]
MTVPAGYRIIREGAALGEAQPRGLIGVSGPDRASYLQGLLTNDIPALAPGSGCYAAWLTPQGRMTTDLHVLESGDMVLLDVPAFTAASVLQRLDQFLFSEQVALADLSEPLRRLELHGPKAAAAIEAALGSSVGLADWPRYRNARAPYAAGAVVAVRLDLLGVPGFVLYVDAGGESALRGALEGAGAKAVSADAIAVARVEAGCPLFGVDMDENTIPLEAGIESRAISLTKGCYVGQEVIIRMLHIGHGRVARKLVGLRFDDGGGIAKDAHLTKDGRDVGRVTSVAQSPDLGWIGLGYVHRDHLAPGTELRASTAAGEVQAVVDALPFRAG